MLAEQLRRFGEFRNSLRQRLLEWADSIHLRSAAQRVLHAADVPLRSALFNAEQMRTHAKLLASGHRPSAHRQSQALLQRLADNQRLLRNVHYLLSRPMEWGRRISPAAEWLLDNNYLIEDQIALAREHLPPGYVKELPWVDSGFPGGCPRVYDMALAVVSHSDGHIDLPTLAEFIAEYQTVTPLKLGELWAIPIMLRLALIENLRRVAALSAADRLHRNLAGAWAQRFVETVSLDAKNVILVVADLARSSPPLNSAFISEFARRLQGQGAALALPLSWVEQQLNAQGLSIEKLIQTESQHQAANQLSISNSISSLRLLGATDWQEFVESVSLVERRLRTSGDASYAAMDFVTRDQYRHVIERIARRAKCAESEVITALLRLRDDSSRHIGFWLLGDGLAELQHAVKAPIGLATRLSRWGRRHALGIYLGPVIIGSVVIATLLALLLRSAQPTAGVPIAIAVLMAIVISQSLLDVANWLTTLLIKPRRLPRMDFQNGVPSDMRTMVVVPTLIGSEAQLIGLVEALEVRYLGNRDTHIHFALLTDWPDSAQQHNAHEAELLDFAQRLIEQLNNRHAPDGESRFFLLHRPRRFNATDKVWMGEERKRGKLTDLNALLLEGKTSGFERIVGELHTLGPVKYVITLDTDTELPRDTARQLMI